MAHPPLQPRPRLREADRRDEAHGAGGRAAGRDAARADPRERIELKLRTLAQLFHSLDPSPFRERELDATAEEFIVDWASDAPHAREFDLVVHLTEPCAESDEDMTAIVSEAVRNHFRYRAERKARELRELLSRGRFSLLVGLPFFGLCLLGANAFRAFGERPLFELAAESLVLGGWVALWRPIEIFFYDQREIRRRRRLYTRLTGMRARVECTARGR